MNLNRIVKINILFIFLITLLSIIGTAALYSAGDGNLNPWALQHMIRFSVFLFMLLLISIINIELIYKYSYFIFFFTLILLLSVELIGLGKGAERWISVFGISIQPSELIKISLILALAKYYNQLRFDRIGQIKNIIIPILFILLPFILILNQPDLGTSITIIILGSLLLFTAGVRMWKFFAGIFLTLFSFPFLWQYVKPYQKKRILSFLNPESDPLGQGYQLIQSKIALGSGAFTGKGFLNGSQAYLEYLPEKQTDFIFTLIGEEFGFIGTIFIILVFIILIIISFYISIKSNHIFGRLLSIGVGINLFISVVTNTAMITGLLPVVGIPLPLISYGGTAMLANMISFGLLLNVEINYNKQLK